jgi:BirA family transcriptional regulator, biotin operon repressor / biotin---[acetyl-CoA-carboxylase] ligase
MTAPPLAQRLLYRLASEPFARGTTAGFVSGPQLCVELGVTRAGVWKAASTLRELGVDIEALPRKGYRLAVPCTPLAEERLRAGLPPAIAARLHELSVVWETGSTNADLLQRPPPAGFFSWRLAEHQLAGRGRRGRAWLAAPGSALCVSWSWRFEALPRHLPSLGLAVGIALVRSLERLGLNGAGLKWPNDVVTDDGKLAGILIEMISEAAGPALVVVGIGLNLALGAQLREAIHAAGNRATDLAALARGGPVPDRNELAAALVADAIDGLLRWEQQGLDALRADWQELDRLHGREIVVHRGNDTLHGVARGIDSDGALLLDAGGVLHRCAAGEVSVRPGAA